MPERNRPNIGYDRAGPTRLERILQDNTVRSGPDVNLDFLRNLQQGPGVIDRTIRNQTPPGEGVINPRNPALPPWQNEIGEGSFWNVRADQPWDNSGIMAMADNRTSINPNTWPNSKYLGIGGYDFVKDHAPKYLDFFQEIKDEDAMARDAGFYPYANPSWIENNPSFGADYMMDILGGKGRAGFRKNLNDDEWNAYAGLGVNF